MKKVLLMLALVSSFALVFSGCSSDKVDEVDKDIVPNGQVEQTEDKDVEEKEINSDETLEEAYQRILDEILPFSDNKKSRYFCSKSNGLFLCYLINFIISTRCFCCSLSITESISFNSGIKLSSL